MSEQNVPRSVEQRIVIEFLVGENVPSAEIHHRLQQQYGEECLLRRHSSPYCCRTAAAQCGLFTYKSVPVIFEPPCTIKKDTEPLLVASKETGLEVNAEKTKYMAMSRDQKAGRSQNMKTDNSSFEKVEEFR